MTPSSRNRLLIRTTELLAFAAIPLVVLVATLSVYDALRSFSIRSMVALAEKDQGFLDALGPHSRFLEPPSA